MAKDPSTQDLARTLDRYGGMKSLKGRPLRVEKVFVEQKTRLPSILLALSIALLVAGLGYAAYQYGTNLKHQRYLAHQRLIEQQELNRFLNSSSPAKPSPPPILINAARQIPSAEKSSKTKSIPTLDGKGVVPAFTVQIPSSPTPEPDAH